MASIRAVCLAAALLPATTLAGEVAVWFGTYTNAKTGAEGISVARFDTDTGRLSTPQLAGVAKNPSFLAFHPRLPMLYAVSEIAGADGKPGGAVEAFAIDEATGRLESRGLQSTGGAGPCAVTVDPRGKVVLAANYGGGSVACLGLTDDGRLEPLVSGSGASGFLQHEWRRGGETGLDPKRQEKPHAHSVDVAPDGRFAFACDLGLDEVLVHALDADRATLGRHSAAKLQAGAGPRHFALHPDAARAWCVNELDLTVTGFDVDAPRGTLRVGPTISTLPADTTDRTGMSCAEIAIHPNGRFLYASNRGHDSLAMYRIVGDTTELEFLGTEPTRAKTPRHFAIAPGGRFLLAGGQASNTVTVFAIDPETGRLTFTGASVDVPSPVCIAFRP
jgi:6-phosphogluconolactonase